MALLHAICSAARTTNRPNGLWLKQQIDSIFNVHEKVFHNALALHSYSMVMAVAMAMAMQISLS